MCYAMPEMRQIRFPWALPQFSLGKLTTLPQTKYPIFSTLLDPCGLSFLVPLVSHSQPHSMYYSFNHWIQLINGTSSILKTGVN